MPRLQEAGGGATSTLPSWLIQLLICDRLFVQQKSQCEHSNLFVSAGEIKGELHGGLDGAEHPTVRLLGGPATREVGGVVVAVKGLAGDAAGGGLLLEHGLAVYAVPAAIHTSSVAEIEELGIPNVACEGELTRVCVPRAHMTPDRAVVDVDGVGAGIGVRDYAAAVVAVSWEELEVAGAGRDGLARHVPAWPLAGTEDV